MLRSPFPGMDPWIEGWCWGDFHLHFIVHSSTALNRQPRKGVVSRIFVREFVDHEIADDLLRERGIVLQRGRGEEDDIVTVIEVPTIWNKSNRNRRTEYLNRRQSWIDEGVHVVEIDLARGGKYTSLVNFEQLPVESRTPYRVCLRRANAMNQDIAVWPIRFQERLPVIPIPNAPGHPDLVLDLQELHDQCYDAGRYDDINYRIDPNPPLSPGDAKWADELLRAKGLR